MSILDHKAPPALGGGCLEVVGTAESALLQTRAPPQPSGSFCLPRPRGRSYTLGSWQDPPSDHGEARARSRNGLFSNNSSAEILQQPWIRTTSPGMAESVPSAHERTLF